MPCAMPCTVTWQRSGQPLIPLLTLCPGACSFSSCLLPLPSPHLRLFRPLSPRLSMPIRTALIFMYAVRYRSALHKLRLKDSITSRLAPTLLLPRVC